MPDEQLVQSASQICNKYDVYVTSALVTEVTSTSLKCRLNSLVPLWGMKEIKKL